MRLSGNLLFGQNFSTPKFFIIPLHVSVRKCQKKYTVIRIFCNPEFRIKCNRFLNIFHIHLCIFLHFNSDKNINILIQFIYISQNKYTQTKLIDDLGISLKKSTLSDILKN